ncbi:MAG: sulfatase-like hydrolase/transferase, partial [Planctomycetota bacterium]
AVAFIERNAGKQQPFFLYFAPYSPHSPFDAPDSYLHRFATVQDLRRRTCLAMMACVDDSVGRMMDSLAQHQIQSNTLVWYVSDNGAPKNGGGSNKPWSGWKGNLTDGGIRVPFSVSWPEQFASQRTYDSMVSTLDVLPTCLSAAGIDELPRSLDGVNLLPYLAGEKRGAPHKYLYFRWTFGANTQAVIRASDWKLIQSGQRHALYDLANDPEETHEVSESHPVELSELKRRLGEWVSTLPEVSKQRQTRRRRAVKTNP